MNKVDTKLEKTTRLGVYRILRKLGVNREDIYPEATFKNDLFFDDKDWVCFLFFVESKFNISLKDEEVMQLKTVESTIHTVDKYLQN